MNTTEERTRTKGEELERRQRLAEIREAVALLREEMRRTEQLFDLSADEDLIEACIYERNAQTARLNYLCRLAKEV